MAQRRAFTEGVILDDSEDLPIDINNLRDDQLRELAKKHGYDIDEEGDDD